ncbi:MAG: hypothetical protein JKX76_15220 [Colwellia sp.]|nr:hypothetical protein [Colwellia sp.]
MSNKIKIAVAAGLLVMSQASYAAYEMKLSDSDTLTFGGYIKFDARHVDGNVGYKDYWIGSGSALTEDSSQTKFFVKESRFNMKYVHGDVTGFLELDFHNSAQGNEIISNGYSPRLRHGFIKYKNILVGQTWSTFMNTSALVETADFGGPLVAVAFIRQGMIRYTQGNFAIALENPESYNGDASQDSVPDIIAKYTFKGDWGNVSVAGLARKLNTSGGNSESAFGASIAGRIKTVGKDDFRFQLGQGELGRYFGTVVAKDLAGEEVEETTSVMVAYRHFWSEDTRSSVFWGNSTTEETDVDNTHWGVNIFKNVTPQLSFGVELGNFELAKENADSNYLQFSAKYVL